MSKNPKLLLILDGYGLSDVHENNAISMAKTPVWDDLWHNRPHLAISSSGDDVGLPDLQMGNSEVGHMNIGAGRILYQDLTKISQAIQTREFFNNQPLIHAMQSAIKLNKAVHIMGLLSPGGVHAHEQHIFALMEMATLLGAPQIYIHGFLDGRDTPPQSAQASLERLINKCKGCEAQAAQNQGATRIQVATLAGRFYAMDRDQRWDRVEAAANNISLAALDKTAVLSPLDTLAKSYTNNLTDEFVIPSVTTLNYPGLVDGDCLIFANFRSDRAIEISQALSQVDFSGYQRKHFAKLSAFITMTHYAKAIDAPCAFPSTIPKNTLGEIIEHHGLKQLRIAETEKYAHVTFFMNAGREAPWPNEHRDLIPSPNVTTYDMAPAMSLPQVTDNLCAAIENQTFDVIICNFANADMVGHTGQLDAAIEAIEAIDLSLGRIRQSLAQVNGEALITADHGNAEQMVHPTTKAPQTAHTNLPIPLVYLGAKDVQFKPLKDGRLADIAPTLLGLLEITPPSEMTGRNLLELKSSN